MKLIVNANMSVLLTGGVIEIFYHDIRIHARPMTLKPQEYSVGYLESLATHFEEVIRAKPALLTYLIDKKLGVMKLAAAA